ncbi:MAG: GNAT family N-acetyltransferase [Saprospiraceae bacterium]
MNIHFANLQKTSLAAIHNAFNDAFSNYQISFELSLEQLTYMLERRGCDLKLSYGAFDGDLLVGFILNGIGTWNKLQTAYDTGTGLRPAYQGKGIAKRLFDFAVADLKENNIQQYLLEVIQTNIAAFSLYQKKGFKVTRELDFYVFPKSKLKNLSFSNDENIVVKEMKIPVWKTFSSLWDFQPTWQNSIDSIKRKEERFVFLVAYFKDELCGYILVEKHTGDIPQLAVRPNFRRKGIGSTLLEKANAYIKGENIKLINLERGCDSIEGFLSELNLPDSLGQYEMVLKF